MTERNIKRLLLEALNKTGDNPEDVSCVYSRRWPDHRKGLMPMLPHSSAPDLPEGELSVLFCYSKKHAYALIRTDTEIKIVTSTKY